MVAFMASLLLVAFFTICAHDACNWRFLYVDYHKIDKYNYYIAITFIAFLYFSVDTDKKILLVYTEKITKDIIIRFKKTNYTVTWYFYQ
jgi:hypothetical protein